jgi:cytochrome c peroxidase
LDPCSVKLILSWEHNSIELATFVNAGLFMRSSQRSVRSFPTHRRSRGTKWLVPTSLLLVATLSCRIAISGTDARLGLPPTDLANRSGAQAALGERLFFDERLSADGTISCANCHRPEKAFSDGLTVARGVHGQPGTRNTPSLWNIAFATDVFWDGRRPSLEQQALDPLLNSREHGLANADALLELVRRDKGYTDEFHRVFGVTSEAIAVTHVVGAIAAYERTLVVGNSPFDRYAYGHDPAALSVAAVRGLALFRGRAQCVSCHTIGDQYALFTDDRFHSVGVGLAAVQSHLAVLTMRIANQDPAVLDRLIGADAEVAALGRFVVTKQPRDIGSFRTPSLRNVALTAPYMHDGSAATLDQALELELYYRSVELRVPLILTPSEKEDLLEFLRALTSPRAAARQP